MGESWLIMLVFLLLGSVLAAVIMAVVNLFSGGEPINKDSFGGWNMLFIYVLPFLVVLFYAYVRGRDQYRRAQSLHVGPYSTPRVQLGRVPLVLFILALPVLTACMAVLLDPLTSWIKMPDFMKELFAQMTDTNLPGFITVVLVAPLLEEWMLRGVALKGMLQHMDPWKAIVWSAVMFGVVHGNPWQAIPAIIMGCLFGWVYYRTRSYWACVSLHALNNGLSFLLSASFPDLPADASLRDLIGDKPFFIAFGAALIVFVLVLFALNKYLAPAPVLPKPQSTLPESEPSPQPVRINE